MAATLEAIRGADQQLPDPTRNQLVPMIKSIAWVQGVGATDLAAANFVGELAVVYAFDFAHTVRYSRLDDLRKLGLSVDDAQPVALQNLRARIPPELATRGDGKSFLFTAGGTFEASLILIPEPWDQLERQHPGSLVCCVLARDVLLVTATGIAGGVASLCAARDRILEQMPASEIISMRLYVRTQRTWLPWAQPTS
ncbi:MAG: DUF1444 family protein [Deltaproteobacteria bacterium]|nr:DUF1444 family protein [Deltaproteobacteria bacterium]